MKNLRTLKSFRILSLTLPVVLLTQSCLQPKTIWKKQINKNIPEELEDLGAKNFNNISSAYSITSNNINLYKHKVNKDYYVNVGEVITKLSGLFDLNLISKNNKNNENVVSYLANQQKLIFNGENEQVEFESASAFSFVKQSEVRDYNEFLRTNSEDYYTFNGKNLRVFEFKKYGIDVVVKDGDVFLPISIFNLLFCSPNYYNLQFNGVNFLGSSFDESRANRADMPSSYIKFYKTSAQENPLMRQNNYNFMAFLFDNYYGLAKRIYAKYNVNNFYEFIDKIKLKEKILSTNEREYRRAYIDLWYKHLDDLHSRLITHSFANKYTNIINEEGEEYSQKRSDHQQTMQLLFSKREKAYKGNALQFYGDTARIILDDFKIGTINQNNTQERWRHDTYWELDYKISQIRKEDPENRIKNIILDISLNGGGELVALQKSLGFLTNKELSFWLQDRISQSYIETKFNIDTNGDGKYNQNDSYSQYNWYVLTGINTFSAANLFADIVKNTKIAKVIGQKSGGGMFSVFPTVLPDGTNVDISSTNGFTGSRDVEPNSVEDLPYTEDGVEPDIKLDYKDFYSTRLYEVVSQDSKKIQK